MGIFHSLRFYTSEHHSATNHPISCHSGAYRYGNRITFGSGAAFPFADSYFLLARSDVGMFALNAQQRYFLFNQSVDMRKSFDGLSGLVQSQMGKDAFPVMCTSSWEKIYRK
jgi:hypothetical protein